MTVREAIDQLSKLDPNAVLVIPSPITGEDDEEFPWREADAIDGDRFTCDPNCPRGLQGKVGQRGDQNCVTIY